MYLYDLYKTLLNYSHYITACSNPPQQRQAATAGNRDNWLLA